VRRNPLYTVRLLARSRSSTRHLVDFIGMREVAAPHATPFVRVFFHFKIRRIRLENRNALLKCTAADAESSCIAVVNDAPFTTARALRHGLPMPDRHTFVISLGSEGKPRGAASR
jgi:hypothetical protein